MHPLDASPVNAQRKPLIFKRMVGVTRIELVTPAMSMQCSPAELHAHPKPRIHHFWSGASIAGMWKDGFRLSHPRNGRRHPPKGGSGRLQHLLDLVDEIAQMEGF